MKPVAFLRNTWKKKKPHSTSDTTASSNFAMSIFSGMLSSNSPGGIFKTRRLKPATRPPSPLIPAEFSLEDEPQMATLWKPPTRRTSMNPDLLQLRATKSLLTLRTRHDGTMTLVPKTSTLALDAGRKARSLDSERYSELKAVPSTAVERRVEPGPTKPLSIHRRHAPPPINKAFVVPSDDSQSPIYPTIFRKLKTERSMPDLTTWRLEKGITSLDSEQRRRTVVDRNTKKETVYLDEVPPIPPPKDNAAPIVPAAAKARSIKAASQDLTGNKPIRSSRSWLDMDDPRFSLSFFPPPPPLKIKSRKSRPSSHSSTHPPPPPTPPPTPDTTPLQTPTTPKFSRELRTSASHPHFKFLPTPPDTPESFTTSSRTRTSLKSTVSATSLRSEDSVTPTRSYRVTATDLSPEQPPYSAPRIRIRVMSLFRPDLPIGPKSPVYFHMTNSPRKELVQWGYAV